MMTSLIHTLESIGLQSLDTIWSPLLIWVLLTVLVIATIRKSKRLDARLHYHLCAGLILSLPVGILTALFAGWIGGMNTGTSTPIVPLIVIDSPFIPADTADPGTASINWILLLTGGALLALLTVSVVRITHMIRQQIRLLTSRSQYTDQTGTISDQLNRANHDLLDALRFRPRILVSREVEIPYAQGFFRPVVVIPESLMNHTDQLNLTLRHELIHIRRGDALLNWVVLLTRELFWFVPLLYPLHRQFKLYREISCDQEVFADPELSRKTYAELLVSLSDRTDRRRNLLAGMSIEPSTLKTRIHAMKTTQLVTTPGKATYTVLGIAMLSIVFGMSCTEMQSNQNPLADTEPVTSSAIEAEGDFGGKTVYVVAETMPELIGGLEGIQEKLVYPEQAREAGTEGRVYIQFVVNERGDVEFPRIMRGIGNGADEEALRVVRDAKFKPARQRGEPVNVQYSLPIEFKLEA